jgi:hypothetical protein
MKEAAEYLDAIVIPGIEDFEQHQGSRRHAFLALLVTFHTVDYLAFNRERKRVDKGRREALRKQFKELCPGFNLVDKAAQAFKHVVSDGRDDEKVQESDLIEHRGEFSSDFSRDFDVDLVYIDGHKDQDLTELLNNVAEFLRTQIYT